MATNAPSQSGPAMPSGLTPSLVCSARMPRKTHKMPYTARFIFSFRPAGTDRGSLSDLYAAAKRQAARHADRSGRGDAVLLDPRRAMS